MTHGPAGWRIQSRRGDATRPFAWLLIASVLLPALAFLGVAVGTRSAALQAAETRALFQAQLLETQIESTLQTHELVIREVAARIAPFGWTEIAESEELHREFVAMTERYAQVTAIWLVRPDGMAVGGSHSFPLEPLDVGDRDYFRAISDGWQGLFVSGAYPGRRTGRMQFNVARARDEGEGPFNGVITISVVPGYFESLFEQVADSDPLSVSLLRDDGSLLARWPALGETTPQLSANNPMVAAALSDQLEGFYWARSELEGVEKVYGWSRIGDYPLVVAVAVPETVALAAWRRQSLVNALAALAACGALVGLTISFGQKRLLEKRLADDRLRTMQELMLDGVVLLEAVRDATGRIVDFSIAYANPAAAGLLGAKESGDLIGALVLERWPGHRDSGLFDRYVAVVETKRPHDIEVVYAADGIEAWFRNVALPVGDGVAVSFGDITPRKRAQDALRTALDERDELLAQKELLIREVHHRVKNSLQLVSSMLRLDAAGSPDPDMRRRMDEAGRRVRAIAGVHEWLYRGRELDRVDIGGFLRELADEIRSQAGLGDAELTVETQSIEVSTDLAVPLSLVVNELVTNAIKHGRAADGSLAIAISLERVADGLSLCVRDHGAGPPAGFDPLRSRGLGMRIVKALTMQLDGTLGWSDAEPGLRMCLTTAGAAAGPSGEG